MANFDLGLARCYSRYNIGGISGNLNPTDCIQNSYNRGNISVSGIVGCAYCLENFPESKIQSVYSVGHSKSGIAYVNDSRYMNIDKAYYLSNSSSRGTYSFNEEYNTDKGIAKNEENMKKTAFAEQIGPYFVYQENDYPVLAWEVGKEVDLTTTTTTSSATTLSTTTTSTSFTTTSNGTSNTASTTPTSNTTTSVSTTTQPVLALEKTEITLEMGQQYTIIANQNNLTYSSNNPSIAVVSKNGGIVTAIEEGEAIISVINADGDVAQLKVTVIPVNTADKYGDANLDGNVTVADAVAILQFIGNKDKYALTAKAKANADCYHTGDGITGNDALTIQKIDAGLYRVEELPINKI